MSSSGISALENSLFRRSTWQRTAVFFACQPHYCVLDARTKREPYLRDAAMNEPSKAPSRVGQGRGCRVTHFGRTNPSEIWPGTFGVLNNSLAFWLKNSLYFSCCLQGGLFLYPQQLHVMHPLSKNARSGKADGFGETNPTVTQIESMQTWPNEPKQSWRRASALAGPA